MKTVLETTKSSDTFEKLSVCWKRILVHLKSRPMLRRKEQALWHGRSHLCLLSQATAEKADIPGFLSLGNTKRSVIFLLSTLKGGRTSKKTNNNKKEASFLPSIPGQSRLYHLRDKPEGSFPDLKKKSVLGGKFCFISTNPAGLPGWPPTQWAAIELSVGQRKTTRERKNMLWRGRPEGNGRQAP